MFISSELTVGLGCIVVFFWLRSRRRSNLPLPPGPPRLPVLGNALTIPTSFAFHYYTELGKKYDSNIVYLEAFGNPIVVLNDITAAKDLLDKRSSEFSSRPHMAMLHDLMDLNNFFALMPYGDTWKVQRRLFQQYFVPRDISSFQVRQLEFIHKSLLPNFYRNPQEFIKHLQDCIGGLAISMTYGLPVKPSNDPWVHLVEEAFTIVAGAAVPGKFLVDIMPWLKYVPDFFPGANFKRDAKEWRTFLKKSVAVPFEAAHKAMINGNARPSFVSASLEKLNEQSPDYAYQVQMISEVCSNIYNAASETIITSITCFIIAMLKHPDVQRRAQREVDSIVGNDRLPDFTDRNQLPYLSAILKEVLRWHPITPAGIPHYTDNETVYQGYYIPKGCTVIYNAHAMLQDERVFPNPEKFIPERFLTNGKLSFDVPDPEEIATFGFGRRICPGMHLGLSTYWLAACSILSLFDILPEVDEKGKPIDTPIDYVGNSVVSGPLPFKCRIVPREGKNVGGLLREFMDVDII